MVHKVHKNENYSVVSNYHLRDSNLSLKAKGLLSLVLSLPVDWKYSIKGLSSICKESDSAIKNALDELKDANYLIVTKIAPNKDNNWRFDYCYDFYEVPQEQGGEEQGIEEQGIGKQGLALQGVENHPLYKITEEPNTELLNTEQPIKEKREKKERKTTSYDDILADDLFISSSPELKDAFLEFIKMRKTIKSPLTDRSLKSIIKKTYEYGEMDIDKMIAILDKSITNDWKDVYPLKDNPKPKNTGSNFDNVI